MSPERLKERLQTVFEEADLPADELRRLVGAALLDYEISLGWDESNKRKPWSDQELRTILLDAPTRENCVKYAKLFHRGYGATEQIYRWAATSHREIREGGRADDAFIQQIKRVAREIGWRA